MHADIDNIIQFLIEEGLLDSQSPVNIMEMDGGVSSDIRLIENGHYKYVLKEARERLKVADNWEADVSRNFAEQAFIEYVASFKPDAVPRIIYRDGVNPYFIMEYLGPPLTNWKSGLLQLQWSTEDVIRVAKLLAEIHNFSRVDAKAMELFDFRDNFYSLRIEPYLITTGDRNPTLTDIFYQEADRLKLHRESLVHGDFSPKNILISNERVVLLDHEVANFGDPAFDIAFLINHLILKKIFLQDEHPHLPDLASIAWKSYFNLSIQGSGKDLKERTSLLILMLMLARVDGKSPVEYLNLDQQERIRNFVYDTLNGENPYDFESYKAKILK